MRLLFAILALSLLFLFGCTQPQPSQPAANSTAAPNTTLNETPKALALPDCGDGICVSPEDKNNCPQDCNRTAPKIVFPKLPGTNSSRT